MENSNSQVVQSLLGGTAGSSPSLTSSPGWAQKKSDRKHGPRGRKPCGLKGPDPVTTSSHPQPARGPRGGCQEIKKEKPQQNQDGCGNAHRANKYPLRLQNHWHPSRLSQASCRLGAGVTGSQPSPAAKTGVSLPYEPQSSLRSPVDSRRPCLAGQHRSPKPFRDFQAGEWSSSHQNIRRSPDLRWGSHTGPSTRIIGEKGQELGKKSQKTR